MKILQVYILLVVMFITNPCYAADSYLFTDVIKSNGTGNIDLFDVKNNSIEFTGNDLEQLRLDGQGKLIFGVDVNEAANGTEKANSQGVAIKSAELILTTPSQTLVYNNFYTKTKSILAEKDSTQRSTYYTLIGDTGSNRITGSGVSAVASALDSTISFIVDRDLSDVVSAQLNVILLDVNMALGDPEAFYDYSNGYEDIGVLTLVDANYLDNLKAGQTEAPLVLSPETYTADIGAQVYYPSMSGYYIVAFEDLYPHRGDYDFNDLVVGYNVSFDLNNNGDVTAIKAKGYLISRGAGYTHDWHLRIALPNTVSGTGSVSLVDYNTQMLKEGYPQSYDHTGDIDIMAFEDTLNLWKDGDYEFVNTIEEQLLIRGHYFTFESNLSSPLKISEIGVAPFDPYLFVRNTGLEIHQYGLNPVLDYSSNVADGHSTFIDEFNYPYALILPETWMPPVEGTDLGEAYPTFLDFVLSDRTSNMDWQTNPVTPKVKNNNPTHWKWH